MFTTHGQMVWLGRINTGCVHDCMDAETVLTGVGVMAAVAVVMLLWFMFRDP